MSTVQIYSAERRIFNMTFASYPEVVAGATISSAIVSATTGLTVSNVTVSSPFVYFELTNGIASLTIVVTCVATLSNALVLEQQAFYVVPA
jgi:hypothetical protein